MLHTLFNILLPRVNKREESVVLCTDVCKHCLKSADVNFCNTTHRKHLSIQPQTSGLVTTTSLLQSPYEAQHYKGDVVVTHMDTVIITVMLTLVDMVSLTYNKGVCIRQYRI